MGFRVQGLGFRGLGHVAILRSPIPNLYINFLGSYSLVAIGKFNLLFLWLIGIVSI